MHHLAIVSFVYPTNDIECLFKIQFLVLFFSKFPLQSPCNVIAMVSGTSLQHVYYSIHRLFHILARSEFDQASIFKTPCIKNGLHLWQSGRRLRPGTASSPWRRRAQGCCRTPSCTCITHEGKYLRKESPRCGIVIDRPTDRPTNRKTGMRDHREVTRPKR